MPINTPATSLNKVSLRNTRRQPVTAILSPSLFGTSQIRLLLLHATASAAAVADSGSAQWMRQLDCVAAVAPPGITR
jgi:hypothetical protein